MVGDVVGDPGLSVLSRRLPALIQEYSADYVVVNGENAASGFGLDPESLQKLFAAGADLVSSGNHIWERREIWPALDEEKRLLRPLNYPHNGTQPTPGRGWTWQEKASPQGPLYWVTVNLQGREYMTPLDCPFRAFDAFYQELMEQSWVKALEPGTRPLILVDFHAESSREKEALSYYLDGRASAVAGTHTHVQTADEKILPQGTAAISDLGMTGVLDGVIGMDPEVCLNRAKNQVLYRMEVAPEGPQSTIEVQGIAVELDISSGKALSVTRFSS